MTLATIGLITTGLFFWIFALSFYSMVVVKTRLGLKYFCLAYYLLGLALITWGIAAYLGGSGLLANSVILGDAFLLIATVFMISLYQKAGLTLLALVGAAVFLYVRLKYYFPAPYMDRSLLIFNTQYPVALGLGAILSLIWLPLNLRVANWVTNSAGIPSLSSIYYLIYTLATISALIFISSRRVLIAGLSFTALAICFILLILSNFVIGKLKA